VKTISLYQPWAQAVARGSKRIETRSWFTHYRGPLAIHAGAYKHLGTLRRWQNDWFWCGVLGVRLNSVDLAKVLPFGAVIAVCELVDVVPVKVLDPAELDEDRFPVFPDTQRPLRNYRFTERMLGNYSAGRYGWVLDNVRVLKEPLPCRGRQGLFNVPDELITPLLP